MKNIKDYIQFGIDNGFKYKAYGNERTDYTMIQTHINDIGECIILVAITSKPFIKAIATGCFNKKNKGKLFMADYKTTLKNAEEKSYFYENITALQAIAIRDNKLEEFINNLLTKQ